MMKKKCYMIPSMDVYEAQTSTVICGSDNTISAGQSGNEPTPENGIIKGESRSDENLWNEEW